MTSPCVSLFRKLPTILCVVVVVSFRHRGDLWKAVTGLDCTGAVVGLVLIVRRGSE